MIEILEQYGFSEKEAKVYMAGLELGSAPASSIARCSGENRATVYSVIRELIKKWYMAELMRNDISFFSVTSPELLAAQLETKYKSFQQRLPELMAVAEKYGNRTKVQFFDGAEGLKRMYDDLLSSQSDIQSFLWTDCTDKVLLKYLYDDFLPRRIESKIHAQVLLPNTPENKKYAGIDKKSYKRSKIVKHPLFVMDGEVNMYWPHKVAIALFDKQEMSWLIIHSEKLYTSLQSIFNVLWDAWC